MGRRRMRLRRNVTPSMRGISTSSVMTSGFSALILSRAMCASPAVPTTSMPASPASISVRICRTSAESSTMSTRTRAARAGCGSGRAWVMREVRRARSVEQLDGAFLGLSLITAVVLHDTRAHQQIEELMARIDAQPLAQHGKHVFPASRAESGHVYCFFLVHGADEELAHGGDLLDQPIVELQALDADGEVAVEPLAPRVVDCAAG